VTWNTCKPGRSPRLRGCIGTFTARPVRSGIAEYALIAALRDHRFQPVSTSELSKLECGYVCCAHRSRCKPPVTRYSSISLLTDFEDAASWDDWEIGTHGIYIHFKPPGRRGTVTATYLPQVMPEQGWTKQEALDSAIAKAGYDGIVDDALRQSVRLERYQSRVCKVSWDEYVRWREAHGETVEV
jgi:uncharacterized protein (TIGR00296 family)